MRLRWAALVAVSVSAIVPAMFAQNPPPIWAGVYTTAQAERGRGVVEKHCSECHHDDLSGGEGPALIGPAFMVKWETHSVERLFHKIRDTMPEVGSSDGTEAQKLDTVAFILQQNGFPPGPTELTDTKNALAALRMLPREGAAVPRSGALVQSVGCLQKSSGNQWMLVQGTDPQVTTRDPLSAADKAAMAATPPGTQTIELLSVYPSAELAEGRVLVKGLFINRSAGVRINVTSVELVDLKCSK
jgi:S-disulfanyl-L-cysteine oxidoreductase SoxD